LPTDKEIRIVKRFVKTALAATLKGLKKKGLKIYEIDLQKQPNEQSVYDRAYFLTMLKDFTIKQVIEKDFSSLHYMGNLFDMLGVDIPCFCYKEELPKILTKLGEKND
jgi:hypothetical protein